MRLLRHRRRVLAATLAVAVVLGGLGLRVEGRLNPTSLSIPGTGSARAGALYKRYFGDSAPFAVLLRGPAAALDRQGPGLVRALDRRPGVTTLSPWDRGAVGRLRPSPRKALILVDFGVGPAAAMREAVPELDRILERRISPPVRATESGFASFLRALSEEALSATERGELIAAPLLLLVLLAVFGSPVAAAVPLLFGAVTVLLGRGVLFLFASSMTIDSLSLIACTMFGLALGVDYSLLMVSRFREERAAGTEPLEAARRTRRTAGRTTIFAGTTLFVGIVVSAFLQPGNLLVSLAVALGVVTAIAVLISWAVVPAALLALGDNLDRWPIGGRRDGRSRLMPLIGRALRRPRLAVVAIAVPLLALAVPALAFDTGAPGFDELPAGNAARHNAEKIDRAIGPGWDATYTVTAAARRGTVADARRLAALAAWQRRVASWPGVQAVIGPGGLSRRVAPLRRFGTQLLDVAEPGGRLDQLQRLGPGLRRASAGVAALRTGLARAARGSGLLGEGSGRAEAGARAIADGIAAVAGGGRRAVAATRRFAAGAKRLTAAQRTARIGAVGLSLGMDELRAELSATQIASARRLTADLAREAASDPGLADDAARARELLDHLVAASARAKQLRRTAARLHGGLGRLAAGGAKLQRGLERLAGAAGGLDSGLSRLGGGSERLAGGLAQLSGGIAALQRGLAGGFHRSYPLQTRLGRAGARVGAQTRVLGRDLTRLHRSSPHIFDSGYFVLSALAGAPPAVRRRVGEAIDLPRGGQAARILVVPTHPLNSAGSEALQRRLVAGGERIGRATGLAVGVSGGAATLNDYGRVTRSRLPLIVAAIVAAIFLVLLAILRAPLLAALVVALNLATVAAAIGVVTLLLHVPAGYPLGGHTYVDTVGAAAIFGVTFGLSIDYAVFLLARMRESFDRDGDNATAVAYGLEKTAGVITGAAAIMAAVFVVFAGAQIATISQMGTGLTVAVLLDATVVRIVLLPALMLLIGERVWWVPKALERVLPRIEVHGEEMGA